MSVTSYSIWWTVWRSHFLVKSNSRDSELEDIVHDGNPDPKFSVFQFLEPFVSNHAARISFKKRDFFYFLQNEQIFLLFWDILGVLEPKSTFSKTLIRSTGAAQNQQRTLLFPCFSAVCRCKTQLLFFGTKKLCRAKMLYKETWIFNFFAVLWWKGSVGK